MTEAEIAGAVSLAAILFGMVGRMIWAGTEIGRIQQQITTSAAEISGIKEHGSVQAEVLAERVTGLEHRIRMIEAEIVVLRASAAVIREDIAAPHRPGRHP